jgi:hypothetical protein
MDQRRRDTDRLISFLTIGKEFYLPRSKDEWSGAPSRRGSTVSRRRWISSQKRKKKRLGLSMLNVHAETEASLIEE